MIDYEKDFKAMLLLRDGESCYVFWSEDSGGRIHCRSYRDSIYDLYSIPLYGGEESFVGTYNSGREALDEAYTWT